jgi:DtxR family transcriptional regulator, Mn-dependent transcriptional regulator
MTLAAARPTEEVLEAIWTLGEQGLVEVAEVCRRSETPVDPALLAEMEVAGLIELGPSGRVQLLPDGRKLAEGIIRRHRLAERLIVDALGVHVDESEDAACEFEHVLAEGITSSICTLLGHPRYCPHGRPVPEGDCCRQAREELKPIVVSCNQLELGQTARVAYLCTREHSLMHKLSALGVTPGARIRLLQKWPSYVLQCDETEIAVEEELARNTYVWQLGG